MKSKSKKRIVVVNKEENSENWCFVCKDGGDLRICDRKDCVKSYHPECIGKDDSFLESDKYWACAWHSCFRCRRSSNFHCYTCSNSVCHRCVRPSDFLQVKERNGFCSVCLRLVLLIEENKDYDSDGEKVDFMDRETCEGLYMEYYLIIKEQEGFGVNDIFAAKDRKEKDNNRSGSISEEFEDKEDSHTDDDTDEHVNDDDNATDDDDDESEDDEAYGSKKKGGAKENKPSEKMSVIKNAMNSNHLEFDGWGSNVLMDFLKSIDKSSSEKLSQNELTSLVIQYVKAKSLFHPKKKRMILCDERLQLLFGRKMISKLQVYDLLETHLFEDKDDSEDEELEYESEDNDSDDVIETKRQRKLDSEKNTQKKVAKTTALQSLFASIIVENMKLVYLRRSLLHDLLRDPESFEEKVIGCYARVKSSLCGNNHTENMHRLVQIKGVKIVSNGESYLLLGDTPDEVCICLVSDENFSAEECEELKQTIQAGQLERPTVKDLQRKAEILHKDLTNNWISKEIALLNNLIDRANEKGWRGELYEYLERRRKLQNPTEKLKLLETLPTVIPDPEVTDTTCDSLESTSP